MSGISSFDDVAPSLTTFARGATVHYTLDGSDPTPASPQADGPIACAKTIELRARTFVGDEPVGRAIRFAIQRMKDRPVPDGFLRK